LSLVAVPGIPEANIEVVESLINLKHRVAESADRKFAIILKVEDDEAMNEKKFEEEKVETTESSNDVEIIDYRIEEPAIVEKAIPYSIHGDVKKASIERGWDKDRAERSLRKWASKDGSGEKDTIDWSNIRYQDFYTKLNLLKKTNKALWNGTEGGNIVNIGEENNENILAFLREKDDNKIISIINLSGEQTQFKPSSDQVYGTYTNVFTGGKMELVPDMVMDISPWSYFVLTN
ncbi:MAG: hypothetical protein DRI88_05310, partial [Bacteroidetes bacterium]